MNDPVTVKFFVGCYLTTEVKILLGKSPSWKQATIGEENPLTQIYHQEKEYLGKYVVGKYSSLKEVKEISHVIQNELKEHCPTINVDTLKIYVLAQLLVS